MKPEQQKWDKIQDFKEWVKPELLKDLQQQNNNSSKSNKPL